MLKPPQAPCLMRKESLVHTVCACVKLPVKTSINCLVTTRVHMVNVRVPSTNMDSTQKIPDKRSPISSRRTTNLLNECKMLEKHRHTSKG